jgi:hypothetical protein
MNDQAVCIVIAAGEGKRWNNYLGKRKHFIEIEGETIIARTVRLLQKYTSKIFVVADSEKFQIAGSTLSYPQLNKLNYDADKFLSSSSLWNMEGRTVLIYGDVYFTEDAIRQIMEFGKREWMTFARFGASDFTGKPYGEIFAHSFYPEHIAEHTASLQNIIAAYSRREIERCGGWEHYRAMEGLPLTEHQLRNRFFEINDWTEDFDRPVDYDRWISARDNRGFIFRWWLKRRRARHLKKFPCDL